MQTPRFPQSRPPQRLTHRHVSKAKRTNRIVFFTVTILSVVWMFVSYHVADTQTLRIAAQISAQYENVAKAAFDLYFDNNGLTGDNFDPLITAIDKLPGLGIAHLDGEGNILSQRVATMGGIHQQNTLEWFLYEDGLCADILGKIEDGKRFGNITLEHAGKDSKGVWQTGESGDFFILLYQDSYIRDTLHMSGVNTLIMVSTFVLFLCTMGITVWQATRAAKFEAEFRVRKQFTDPSDES